MELKENEKIESYLNSICSQIKNSKVHSDIQEEFRCHIEEVALDYMEGGFSETEAINNAIAHMGDAAFIGLELNEVHKQKPEWSIVILTSIFAILGLALIFTIDSSGILGYSLFSKSAIGTLIGIFFAALLYYFDYMKIKSYSIYIYLVTVLIVLFTIIFGIPLNGKPYLFIGMPINIIDVSPSLFIISLAGILGQFDWKNIRKSIYGILLLIIPIFLMTAAHSFTAALTYSTSVIVILIMSGVKIKSLFKLLILSLAPFSLYIFIKPYPIQRLLTLLNANSDPLKNGYFNLQLSKLITSAGKWGQGLTFEKRMLPDVHTDFIFTYMVYTFGLIAGLLLISLIALFLIRMASITVIVKNSYGKLLICGLTSIFAVQFVWNIIMNLGLVPITNMNLPFISYGSSQFVINMAAIGIISNVYKQRNNPIRTAS